MVNAWGKLLPSTCTASVVGQRWVLIAGHCVHMTGTLAEDNDQIYNVTRNGTMNPDAKVTAILGLDNGMDLIPTSPETDMPPEHIKVLNAVRIYLNPFYGMFDTDEGPAGALNDLALIEVSSAQTLPFVANTILSRYLAEQQSGVHQANPTDLPTEEVCW